MATQQNAQQVSSKEPEWKGRQINKRCLSCTKWSKRGSSRQGYCRNNQSKMNGQLMFSDDLCSSWVQD